MYQIIMLYVLNVYNYICQLFLQYIFFFKWMILARRLHYTKTDTGPWTQTGMETSDKSQGENISSSVTILNDSWSQLLMQGGQRERWGPGELESTQLSEGEATAQLPANCCLLVMEAQTHLFPRNWNSDSHVNYPILKEQENQTQHTF